MFNLDVKKIIMLGLSYSNHLEKRIMFQRRASAGTICWGFSTWPPVGFSTLAIKERARTMNHGAETGSMTLLCFRACWCGVVAGGGGFLGWQK